MAGYMFSKDQRLKLGMSHTFGMVGSNERSKRRQGRPQIPKRTSISEPSKRSKAGAIIVIPRQSSGLLFLFC